jgi:metal-responsive CopG/Arc/MetJ family transcriptional regulator
VLSFQVTGECVELVVLEGDHGEVQASDRELPAELGT